MSSPRDKLSPVALCPAMSHEPPYGQPPSDTDLRPESGPYASLDRGFYGPPRESRSPSRPSSSAPWSQDGVLSILSSCGLEPGDLSLLAELPEDVLTVESLPHVLNQIKGKRGTVNLPPASVLSPSPSSSSSYPPGSARRPAASPRAGDWDQPVQYPMDRLTPGPFQSERVQDRWMSRSGTSGGAVGADRPSSSSSVYAMDVDHRPGPSEFSKTGRDGFSSTRRGQRTRPSRFSEPGSAGRYRPRARGGRPESRTSSVRSGRTASPPSEGKARDFHGTRPQVFPYSCSLCDITVLSEKVWIQHINSTQHADGQLRLLQQFPDWDCRVDTVSRADDQSEKKKAEGMPARPPQTANQKTQTHKPPHKKAAETGKVVCVRFPAQSVDEAYLRKLTEPFGKLVKILMFPSLAFVELGSADQAQDLVKFHGSDPPRVNGEQIQFGISSTFSFLQSSRVVSFAPPPTGEDGRSDLISIVKRFGPPLCTLFLPSAAFVEMRNDPDAQKLVDYYSSHALRVNDDTIKVSFSAEYNTLTGVASAKRYEEEASSGRRKRSRSREREEEATGAKRRRSSEDGGQGEGRRSRGRTRTRSRSRSRSREKTVDPEKPGETQQSKDFLSTESRTEPDPAEAESSSEESDIEGMEVIGEDGENLEDEETDSPEEDEEVEDGETDRDRRDREDGEEEPDFPVDLENCITLDELRDEQCDVSASESDARKSPGRESSDRKTRETDEESGSRKAEEEDSGPLKTSPEQETLERRGTDEKTLKTESIPADWTPQREEEETSEPAVQDSEKSPDPPDSTGDPPKPAGEEGSVTTVKLEHDPEPAGGAAEPQKPTKPVGTKFVRPVVGYFCELCQVIYAEEDEAKLQHCSSLTHYRKYQEKTGEDPWTS